MLPEYQANADSPVPTDFYKMKRSDFLSIHSDVSKDEYNITLISEFSRRQHEGRFYPCPRCGSAATMKYRLQENSYISVWNIFICPVCGNAEESDYSDLTLWDIVEKPFKFFREFAQF